MKKKKSFEQKSKTQRIGEAIRAARERMGMTQVQLADELGCSAASVSEWERGVHAPGGSIRQKLAEALSTTWDEIEYGIDRSNYVNPNDYAYALYKMSEYRQSSNWIMAAIMIAILYICIFTLAFRIAGMTGDEAAQLQFLLVVCACMLLSCALFILLILANVRQYRYQKKHRDLLRVK